MIDQGQGPPTLLLHGIFDSADTWRVVIENVQSHLRCIAPDLPGFGRSGLTRDFDGSLPGLAGFVDKLLASTGIDEPVNLVMYDIGGTYGLAWAVTNPEKVRRLAILNSNFFSDYKWHLWARLWRMPVIGELAMAAINQRVFAFSLRRVAPRISPEQARDAARLVTPQAKRMALRHYRALMPSGFQGWEERLPALIEQVPTMVCWGDLDPFAPSSWAERFGADEVYHFRDAGHWLPLEAPAELSEKLVAFLASNSSKPASRTMFSRFI